MKYSFDIRKTVKGQGTNVWAEVVKVNCYSKVLLRHKRLVARGDDKVKFTI